MRKATIPVQTKREQAIQYLKKGDLKSALRIAKDFKLNVSDTERFLMRSGYEYLVHPKFYQELHVDIESGIKAAERTVRKVLGYARTD